MYASGKSVPEDDVTAYAWLNIAAAQGQSSANEGKEHVAKRMTQSQVARPLPQRVEDQPERASLANAQCTAIGPGRQHPVVRLGIF